jgi:penicillin-binding protein 1A
VWVGFDQPRSTHEYGARAALPIWLQFMQGALADKPEHSIKQPPGITTVRIDSKTGLLAAPEQKEAIFEMFIEETVPQTSSSEQSLGEEELEESYDITSSPLF